MTNQTINIEQGERVSFIQLIQDKEYQIEIPIIQRDYAQGRSSYDENRMVFLNALKTYLDENIPERDLDFIYGTVENQRFIPLDGQQRLTTLFLLHWYLALKDEKIDDFRLIMTSGDDAKFRYKTRASSTDFFDALLKAENQIDLNQLTPNNKKEYPTIARIIKDCGWFFNSWEKDPTIQSILIMMDAIHHVFQGCDNYYERLVDNRIITFMFLNIGQYGLTDDLYIKMNSRGKPLTPFENFKARLEQEIRLLFGDGKSNYELKFGTYEKVSVQKYFSHLIDTEWTNLFWQYRNEDNEIDDKILNFIKATFINYLANKGSETWVKEYRNKAHISFLEYKETELLEKDFIIELIEVLNQLKNENNKIKQRIEDTFYYQEYAAFEQVLDYNFTNYNQRIQFYAYCQYLKKWKTHDGLNEWMRIVHNLTQNVIYNNEGEYIRGIKGISILIPYSNKIIQYLVNNGQVDGFNKKQVTEERIKAYLFGKTHWKEAIKKAEQHGYFTGQIGFLLNFSGIENYFEQYRKCDWSDMEDEVFFDRFNNYYQKSIAVFGEKGLKDFSNYSFRRALFSKGDYLLKEGRNLSFLIDVDRDISWKRLLFDGGSRDKNEPKELGEKRRNYLKMLFDDALFDLDKLPNCLTTVIETSLKRNDLVWRRGFIDTPQLFSYMKKNPQDKSLNIRHTNNSTYLLKGKKTSGNHAELQTLHFYYNHLKGNSYAPFNVEYYPAVGEDFSPCFYFDGWRDYEMDVFFYKKDKEANTQFQFKFYNKQNDEIEDEVMVILKKHHFEKEDDYYTISSTYDNLKVRIEEICKDLDDLKISTP